MKLCTLTVLASTAAAFPTQRQSNNNLRGLRATSSWCPSFAPSWVCKTEKDDSVDCPAVTPTTDFDIDKYISESWFVQKQQENGYQKKNDLFCVTATYNKDRKDGLVTVSNRANKGGINQGYQGKGKGIFSSFSNLCAKQLETGTGKLEVQPCFLFNPLNPFDSAGPYWVLAVDDAYDWAIISGGQPTDVVKTTDGSVQCTTKESGTNGSGLWLFSRVPVASDAVIKTMEDKLEAMGVSTSKLLPVAQKGCTYKDMPLKTTQKNEAKAPVTIEAKASATTEAEAPATKK